MKTKMKKSILFWAIYWLIVIFLYVALSVYFGSFLFYAMLPVMALVYFLSNLLLSLPLRFVKNHRLRTALTLLAVCGSIGLTCFFAFFAVTEISTNFAMSYIHSLDYGEHSPACEISYREDDGVYTLRMTKDELKILQLTDVHLGESLPTIFTDRKALKACYDVILQAEPDLILVTGDLVYAVPLATFSNNNMSPFYAFLRFMENFGIPWAMVYGNHDTEAFASHQSEDLEWMFESFSFSHKQGEMLGQTFLYSKKQPQIYGRYNQYLRVENADGTLNRLLFLIDSNDYVAGSLEINDYDSVHRDQIEWYLETIDKESEAIGRTVPSFVFQHIPFKAFADADSALKVGDPAAEYLFGENGERVSCPEKESGFFDAILQKQSTQAVFAGHDHLNNLGVKYRGVDLVYGKSIDYLAYPGIAKKTSQRGGTLVRVSSGGYLIEQISLSAEP